MITPSELEIFQACPARWKLMRTDKELTSLVESDYAIALKKTLFRMYAWRMSNNKSMRYESVREHWDKNWWATKLDEGDQKQPELMELAVKGWLWLEKYWGEIYINEEELHPVAINFEFSFYSHELHHRIHIDLLMSDNEKRMTYVSFGGKKTEWDLFTSLGTKAEITGMAAGLSVPPVRKLHYDILTKNIKTKTLNISPQYLRHAQTVVSNVSRTIHEEAITTAPSEHCRTCPYKGRCWF